MIKIDEKSKSKIKILQEEKNILEEQIFRLL